MFPNDPMVIESKGSMCSFCVEFFFLPLEQRDKGPVKGSGREPDSSLFDDLRANEPTHSR